MKQIIMELKSALFRRRKDKNKNIKNIFHSQKWDDKSQNETTKNFER
jgi:hypothetical protein